MFRRRELHSFVSASLLAHSLLAVSPVRAQFWVDELIPPEAPVSASIPAPNAPPKQQANGWWQWRDARYRLESDGNLACFTENGSDCADFSNAGRVSAWFLRVTPMTALTPLAPRLASFSLTCGQGHARVSRGQDGYAQPDHWCNAVYATIFASWTDLTPHGVGYLVALTPTDEVMCLSYDGKACAPAKSVRLKEFRLVSPLICGAHHLKQHGITGYDRPTHWCAKARGLSAIVSPFDRLRREIAKARAGQ